MKARDNMPGRINGRATKAQFVLPTSVSASGQSVGSALQPGKRNRGINVFTAGRQSQWQGRDRQGDIRSLPYEIPRFILTPEERFEIFQLQSHIFGIITGRMNKIGGLEYKVVPKKKIEDKIVHQLKMVKSVVDDYMGSGDLMFEMAGAMLAK